jgi:ABC-type multidrug transport system permease subunit
MNTTALPLATTTRSSRTGDLTLLLDQLRYDQRSFWRNRSRAFFSVAFPLVFLVVFDAVNGGHHITELGGISYSTWFVPGILAYGVMMSTFMNLAISTAVARDNGLLKRKRGTPLPPWVFIAGRIGSAVVTTFVLVVATLLLGRLAYGVDIRTSTMLGMLLTLSLGTACFTTLGLAVTAIIPNADAAPAIVNVLILPLTFISGIWMVIADAPTWLDTTARIFPVRAFAHGLQHAFDPGTRGNGVVIGDLLTLMVWALVGVSVCIRWFRWEPRR